MPKNRNLFLSVHGCVMKLPTQDMIGAFLICAVLPISFIYEVTFAISFWHSLFSLNWLLRIIPLFVLSVNAYLNLMFVIREGPNGALSSSSLPSVQMPGYKYCYACNINAPPRSHHCPTCNTCIYRRDHHCSFVGVCVGHYNQRYFIGAVANFWILSAWCFCLNWSVLWSVALPKFTISQLGYIMMPHFAFIFGRISAFQFICIFAFFSSLVVLAFVTYLAAAQVFCIWRGQTRVEYLLDVKAYDLGSFPANLRQALGNRWPLLFISPFLDTQLESDGRSFRVRDRYLLDQETKIL